MKKRLLLLLLLLWVPMQAQAMHIMEGFLPMGWAAFWWLALLPVLFFGTRKLSAQYRGNANAMLLLAMAGAYAFVLSALKLPSLTGSCSHPTGMGLGTLLFGPLSIAVVGVIVLFFQAVLLAHGGITTLGANSMSMAFAGPLVTWLVYGAVRRARGGQSAAVFVSVTLGSLATYCFTAFQLALAHPSAEGGIAASMAKFALIFAPTQLPISVMEGMLTIAVVNTVQKYQFLETGVFRIR